MRIAAQLFLSVALASAPARAADDGDTDRIDVADAIACRIDAPSYTGFAMAVSGDGGIAEKRQWAPVKSASPFMTEYQLPAPITIAGHATRRIAFTGSGVMAVLDVADPAVIARAEGIANAMDPEPLIAALVASGKVTRARVESEMKFRKFEGERIMVDRTEPAGAGERFGTHVVIARTVSNVVTHPGKTFYGCSYRIEILDEDGKPL